MGVLVEDLLLLAQLDQMPEPRRVPVDLRELAEQAVDDARVRRPGRAVIVARGRRPGRRARRPRPAAPAAGQPDPQRGHPHPGRARRSSCAWPRRGADAPCSRSATTVRACPPDDRRGACSSASGEPRAGAAADPAAPDSAWPSSARSCSPTAARSAPRTRDGGGAPVPDRSCRSPDAPASQESLSLLSPDAYSQSRTLISR